MPVSIYDSEWASAISPDGRVRIEMQDGSGHILYPHTSSNVVFGPNGNSVYFDLYSLDSRLETFRQVQDEQNVQVNNYIKKMVARAFEEIICQLFGLECYLCADGETTCTGQVLPFGIAGSGDSTHYEPLKGDKIVIWVNGVPLTQDKYTLEKVVTPGDQYTFWNVKSATDSWDLHNAWVRIELWKGDISGGGVQISTPVITAVMPAGRPIGNVYSGAAVEQTIEDEGE